MKFNVAFSQYIFILGVVVCLYSCDQSSNIAHTAHQKGILLIDSLNQQSFDIRSKHKDSSYLLAKQALAESKKFDYKKGVSKASLNLGMYYLNRDSLNLASDLLMACQIDFENQKDDFHLGMTNWYLAKLYMRQGKVKESERYYQQAADLFERLGDRKMAYYVRNGHAVLLTSQGMHSKALGIYENLLDDSENLDLSQSQGGRYHVFNNIADIFINLGRYQEALIYLRKAIKDAKSSNHPTIKSYRLASQTHHKIGNRDSANYFINLSLNLAVKKQIPNWVALAYFKKADYSEEDGDIMSAIDFMHKGINLIKDSQSVMGIVEAQSGLAQLHERLNDTDSTIYYLRRAFVTTQRGNLYSLMREISGKLSSIYQKNEQVDSAFYYLSIKDVLSQKIFDEEMAKQFAKMNVTIATLEKEREVQRAITEKIKSENQRNLILVSCIGILLTVFIGFFRYRKQSLMKNKLLESEKKSLSVELERNKQLLSTQTLNMIHKNNGFSEIAESLKEVNGTGKKIKQIIDINMALEKDWDNFNLYFSQVHSDFYDKLSKEHPSLSVNDIRLCALVKMGLKNKEISSILNIKYESINMAKYRLKKKMDLGEDADINDYIRVL